MLMSESDGAMSRLVRYSFRPIFAAFALARSMSAVSVFRQVPVPILDVVITFTFVERSFKMP